MPKTNSWSVVPLEEVASINCEATRGWPSDKEIRYIEISGVTANSGINQSSVRSMSFGVAPTRARRVVRKGDILIATVRPYLRAFAVVDEALDGQVASTGFAVLRVNPERCLPDYVWAVVRTDVFVEYLMSKATGSAYPAVNAGAIGAYSFNLPPLALQRRIADLIGSVDAYVDELRVCVDTARAARSLLLHDLLAPDRADFGWRGTTLGEIAQVVSGGTPKTKVPEYWGGDIVWVIPSEVVAQEGGVIKQSERMITQAGFSGSSAKMLPKGAVLLTSRATIGAVALAGVPLCTNQGFASLVPSEAVMSHFLMYWCQANTHEFTLRSGGNTFKEVSRKKVARIPITLPPLSEQRKVVDLIKSVDNHIGALHACVDLASGLRTGLLSDLLSGRHEIPVSYDRLLRAV